MNTEEILKSLNKEELQELLYTSLTDNGVLTNSLKEFGFQSPSNINSSLILAEKNL